MAERVMRIFDDMPPIARGLRHSKGITRNLPCPVRNALIASVR